MSVSAGGRGGARGPAGAAIARAGPRLTQWVHKGMQRASGSGADFMPKAQHVTEA